MYIGIKHNSTTSLTIGSLQLYQTTTETVTDVVNTNRVIAVGATVGFNVNDAVFNQIKVMAATDLTPVTISLFAKNAVNDPWVAIDATNKSISGFVPNQTLTILQNNIDIATAIQPTLTTAQYALIDAMPAAQRDFVYSLPVVQQITLVSGTSAQKSALIATFTIEQQALFTSTPIQFIQTIDQANADKLTLSQIATKLISGQFISDNDSVFYALGNSLMATAAMAEIDAGRGFDGLRNIGLTQAQALKVLSIYNVTIDTGKYESEVNLQALSADPNKIVALQAYLAGMNPPLALPSMVSYLGEIRANHAVYAAIANWQP
jgi:hypothetical protein